jgi:CBS domain-containing protein
MTNPEMPFLEFPVDRLMTRRPATIEPDASLADACQALLRGGFRHLPVVNGQGRAVGMISERDLRARLGTDLYGFTRATVEALSEPVSGVMTPDPIAVPTGTRLGDVLETFADERVGALLVVDAAEAVVGILSYVDLLLWLRERAAGGPAAPRRAAPRKAPGKARAAPRKAPRHKKSARRPARKPKPARRRKRR